MMREPRFGRRRIKVRSETHGLRRSFCARLPSADHGLFFHARFAYGWEQEPSSSTALLHGDAVARSLLTTRVADALVGYPVLMAETAEDMANRALSTDIRDDARLSVSGHVVVSVPKDTLAVARGRIRAAEVHRIGAAGHVARLEALREILLDRTLGPVWWVDRFADLQFAAGDPKAKTESVLEALRLVTEVLRADGEPARHGENALIKARIEELISAFQDPDTRPRMTGLLESVLGFFASTSVPAPSTVMVREEESGEIATMESP
jgi:hypothetical protein